MTVPGRLPLAMTAVLVLAACASAPPAPGAAAGARVPAVNAADAPLLPARADALPDFTLARYQQLLSQLRGTPVVVNMWGSWCPPCTTEAPLLADAHARFGERVQFLGIDIEDSVGSARAFIRRHGWTFPSIRDPAVPSAFRSGLGFAGQPNTLFYAGSGDLVWTWQGPLTEATLRLGIQRILGTR